jgi:glycine cleavage system H lipoate-binding protein
MTELIAVLEALGSFIVGAVGRAGVALLAGFALAAPALAVAVAIHQLRRRRERTLARASGIAWRRSNWYAPNHTWLAARRGDELAVGIDDFGQRLLPSATSVELPRSGMAVGKGDPIAVVRAGGHVVRIGAPVAGTVLRVNGRVRRDPSLLKSDPYGAGWLFTIAPADAGYLRFPREDQAEQWFGAEQRRLSRFLEGELGLAAADGGDLVAPAPSLLGEAGWKRVLAEFLHTA